MNRHETIRNQLNHLGDRGVIEGYEASGQWPGKRWTLWGKFSTGRAFTTAEVEIFILGADAGMKFRQGTWGE